MKGREIDKRFEWERCKREGARRHRCWPIGYPLCVVGQCRSWEERWREKFLFIFSFPYIINWRERKKSLLAFSFFSFYCPATYQHLIGDFLNFLKKEKGNILSLSLSSISIHHKRRGLLESSIPVEPSNDRSWDTRLGITIHYFFCS